MVNCPKCGWVPEKVENLPIRLPEVEAYEPTDDGLSPLSRIESFVNCKCPVCGEAAKRETDTMPNWAGSDWYFLRYCDPHNMTKLADFDILKKWLPVDVYVGGDEHNTLHLLYSRFIHQFLFDLGLVPTAEPYFTRMSHGVILGSDGARMSKSKGNVIVPEMVADKYGVDVIRMYLMFMGPFTGTMAWNEKTLMGVKRFLDRLEGFIDEQITNKFASKTNNSLVINKMIKGIGEDLEDFGFNTAIAKMMEGLNSLKEANKEEVETIIKLLTPLAPYMAEELWSRVGNTASIHAQNWPEYDESKLAETEINIPVAVNGKVRGQLIVKEDAIKEAKELARIKPWTDGKEIVKEIYIPGKMINLVIKQ
jgi:leucyl-tRNA synthetase